MAQELMVVATHTDAKGREFKLMGDPDRMRKWAESFQNLSLDDEDYGLDYINSGVNGMHGHFKYDRPITPEERAADVKRLINAACGEGLDWTEILKNLKMKKNGTLHKNVTRMIYQTETFGTYWEDSYKWGNIPTIRIQNIDDFTAELQWYDGDYKI